MKILRPQDLLQLLGVSQSTLYRLTRHSDFPRRVPLGSKLYGWVEDDILTWIENQSEGGSKKRQHCQHVEGSK